MKETLHQTVHKMCRVTLLHRYHISTALKHIEIYRGQPEILEYLVHHGDCPQIEIAKEFGVSPASIATSIKRMSKSGLIERTVDEENRRANKIRITEKGRLILEKGRKECDRVDEKMFSGFSDEEIEQFSFLLSKLADNLSPENISDKEILKILMKKEENE